MATRQQILDGIKAADKAGDAQSVKVLAAKLKALEAFGGPATGARPFPLQIDSSPVNVIPKRLVGKGGEVRTLNKEELDLGSKGVAKDIPGDGPITWDDYAKISTYSAGPEYSAKWIGDQLKQRYQLPTGFDGGQLARVSDGKLQYLDITKGTPRWRYIDESMWDAMGDPGTAMRFGGEIATDLVAGAGGALAGGAASPLGSVAVGAGAAGANAALWRYNNLKKGQEFGFQTDLTDDDLKTTALGRGMQTAGYAALFGMPFAWGSSGKAADASFFDTTSADAADKARKNLRTSDEIVENVNAIHNRVPGRRESFNPSPAKKSGIEEVIDAEADLRAGHAARRTAAISKEIEAREAADRRVLEDVWKDLLPYDPLGPAERRQASVDLMAEADTFLRNNQVAVSEREARRLGGQITRESRDLTPGQDITPTELLDVIRGEPSPNGHIAGTKFYDLYDNISSEQARLNKEVIRLSRGADGNQVRVNFANVRDRLLTLRAKFSAGTGAIPGEADGAEIVDRLFRFLRTNDGQLSWRQFDADYQAIGRAIEKRSRPNFLSTDATVDIASLEELRSIYDNALEFHNNSSLKSGYKDLIEVWKKRKSITQLKHDIFDSKVIRGAMATEDPEKLLPENFVNQLFPAEGAAYLRTLYNHVKGDPDSLNGLRRFFLQQYRKEVLDPRTGRPNLSAHMKFLTSRKEQLDVLFDGKIPSGINRLGALEQSLEQEIVVGAQKAKILRRHWATIMGKQYREQGLGVEDIFTRMSNLQATSQQLADMADYLGRVSPDTLAAVQRQAINIRRLKLEGSKDLPKSEGIRKMLEGHEGRKFLAIMGANRRASYEADLRTLAGALEIVERTGKAKTAPTASGVQELIRIYTGPLSRFNRFITGARRFSTWADASRAYEVISDPERLHRALLHGTGGVSEKVQNTVPTAVAMDLGALWSFFEGNDD